MSLDHIRPRLASTFVVLGGFLSIVATIATRSRLGHRGGTVQLCLAALVLSATGAGVQASDAGHSAHDLEREARLRAEIVDLILDGHPLDLRVADGPPFLAIEAPAGTGSALGTALILHGRGLHPDEGHVAHPLRVGLAARGWNTLAIQLPVLDKSARYYDYLPVFPEAARRIASAVEHVRAAHGGPVVVVAHSCGTHMAQHWLLHDDGAGARIDAYVGIGMGATDYGQPMREPFGLEQIDVPVLDLYGEFDFPAVRRLAEQRMTQMLAGGNPLSAQRVMPGVGHYHEQQSTALVDAVAAWLDGVAAR